MDKKIIILEDDPATSDILRIILHKNGYIVEEYLEASMLVSYRGPWPDLFLLDKQLTERDGLDVCKHLKNQLATRNIPVIILSATPNLHHQVSEVGADAYIEKPFSSQLLLSTIAD